MTQPIVSISVPVYKTEKDLPRCIESLLNQTLSNIEIILIDDGSPDRCGIICDEYAAKDSRIKVIHQTNRGSAAARQAGLELSSGIYYTVCDSDDWIEPTMYEELYAKAEEEKADIVACDFYNEYSNGKQVRSESYSYTTQEQYIEDLMLHKTSVSTWSKLFKLSRIRELGINYTLDVNLGEDALFLFHILLSPQKIVTLNRALYHYQRNINSSSYTNNITMNSVANAGYLHNWIESNYPKQTYKRLHQYSLINYAFTALRYKKIDRESYNYIIKDVSLIDIIKNRALTTKAILILLIKLLGLRFGHICLRLLYRLFYR